MKKISFLMVMFMAAVLCMTTSCKKSDNNGEEPQPQAKYLTLEEFAKKSWSGADAQGHGVSLAVQSTTKAKLQYTPKSVSKNTDPEPVSVDIVYEFDPINATFKGTGNDNNEYTAKLKSKTELEFYVKPLGETVVLK